MISIKNVKRADGSIEDVSIDSDRFDEIEGKGLMLLPALIDPHVHFRVPGGEYKEDWITGSLAAIQGGVTSVIDMPNNRPSCSTLENLKEKQRLIQKQLQESDIPLRPFLYFGADKNHLKEIPKCKGHSIGIKVFMGSSTGDLLIDDDKDLQEIFKMAADLDLPVAVHAEDERIIASKRKGFESSDDPSVHSKIRCREAAIHATEKALCLAEKVGTKLIVLHVSTKEELALIREAKRKKITVHAEAAPHHLFLTTDHYRSLGNRALVNPPLREKEDQECLWKALRDGTIDFIGSDHAPHTLEDKRKGAAGMPGIEFILPLMLTAVSEGKISLEKLVQLTRTNIEAVFGIPPTQDYVLVTMDKRCYVKEKDIRSKCKWSPYVGMNLTGRPVYTIVQGRVFHLNQLKCRFKMARATPLTLAPIYDIHKTYLENIHHGPVFQGVIPKRLCNKESEWTQFLGYSVASPIGVPAGPLLNSRWCKLAADLGFDIVTYKTIRSAPFAGHPLPNIVMVKESPDTPGSVEPGTDESSDSISITNSFGMPSMPEEYLLQDIDKARKSLVKGQILIVSIVGTSHLNSRLEDDFVKTALIAKEAGAHAIEANFSCPNVATQEGCLYLDAKEVFRIATALVKAVSPLPLLIKLGLFPNTKQLRETLAALAKAGVRAVEGINSLPMKVINADGSPALGKGRESSGICGDIIRPKALLFIREAAAIIHKERLDLELAGCGGITEHGHFDEFLMSGAKVALSATGMMWNPYLAVEWHQKKERKSNG